MKTGNDTHKRTHTHNAPLGSLSALLFPLTVPPSPLPLLLTQPPVSRARVRAPRPAVWRPVRPLHCVWTRLVPCERAPAGTQRQQSIRLDTRDASFVHPNMHVSVTRTLDSAQRPTHRKTTQQGGLDSHTHTHTHSVKSELDACGKQIMQMYRLYTHTHTHTHTRTSCTARRAASSSASLAACLGFASFSFPAPPPILHTPAGPALADADGCVRAFASPLSALTAAGGAACAPCPPCGGAGEGASDCAGLAAGAAACRLPPGPCCCWCFAKAPSSSARAACCWRIQPVVDSLPPAPSAAPASLPTPSALLLAGAEGAAGVAGAAAAGAAVEATGTREGGVRLALAAAAAAAGVPPCLAAAAAAAELGEALGSVLLLTAGRNLHTQQHFHMANTCPLPLTNGCTVHFARHTMCDSILVARCIQTCVTIVLCLCSRFLVCVAACIHVAYLPLPDGCRAPAAAAASAGPAAKPVAPGRLLPLSGDSAITCCAYRSTCLRTYDMRRIASTDGRSCKHTQELLTMDRCTLRSCL